MVNYPTGVKKTDKSTIVEKKHKYNAKKATYDGINFDSQAELGYYLELKKQGKEFKIHESFEIVSQLKMNGKTYRARKYTPDFTIYENGKLIEAIDVKGMKMTADASLRIRIFIDKYRIPIYIVRIKNKQFEKKLF